MTQSQQYNHQKHDEHEQGIHRTQGDGRALPRELLDIGTDRKSSSNIHSPCNGNGTKETRSSRRITGTNAQKHRPYARWRHRD